MFWPYDKVLIINHPDAYYKTNPTVITETHFNIDGTVTYKTAEDWRKERTVSELKLYQESSWCRKIFKKEFEPGDRVKWSSRHHSNISTITKKIYMYNTSRIYYRLDCGMICTASNLSECKGGI